MWMLKGVGFGLGTFAVFFVVYFVQHIAATYSDGSECGRGKHGLSAPVLACLRSHAEFLLRLYAADSTMTEGSFKARQGLV